MLLSEVYFFSAVNFFFKFSRHESERAYPLRHENETSIELARSGHIGKYYADQFSMLLSSTASSQYSSRTNNDNFFHNSAVKDFSFILSFL